MRIISYNILDGGEGRADVLGEVIEAQRADVVGLVEAERLDVIERLARRLKMDFIHAPGRSKASALLSRWTIRETINHAPRHESLSKSLLEATVVDPAGAEWTLGVVHFHAGAFEADEARREEELGVLLATFKRHRAANRPHLLMGDFNSNAPYQIIDPAHCKPKTREAWEHNGGEIPRRVVQKLLDAGYRDSLRETDPAAAQTLASFTTRYPGQRVDYIFTHGLDPAHLRSGWIEQDRLATYASDHYPVGVEIT